jgi:hypothetical protein
MFAKKTLPIGQSIHELAAADVHLPHDELQGSQELFQVFLKCVLLHPDVHILLVWRKKPFLQVRQ